MISAGLLPVKRALKERYHAIRLAGLRDRPSTPPAGRPAVAGFLSSPFGLGAGARLIADGLAEAGLAPALFDISRQLQPDRALLDYAMPHEDDGRGPVIIHVNPPELGACLEAIGPERLKGRRLIGYWAWEQQKLPDGWARAARWLDEIWVPSRFVADAVAPEVDIPVHSVGYPAGLLAGGTPQRDVWRARLGLPGDGFCALAAFDPRSSVERKNPQGAIAAFQQAFSGTQAGDDTARLVLKVTGSIAPQMREALGLDDERILLVEEYLDNDGMMALIASADCVLNLHRAEGYGLLPVQALCLGIPAIMTGWSSVTDFAESPGAFLTGYEMVPVANGAGPYSARYGDWADPSIGDAAGYLRQIRAMPPAGRRELGAAARDWWRRMQSPQAFVDRLPAASRSLFKPA